MNVLIVDDNSDDRRLLRYSLAKHGCEQIIEARDGQEGLEMAKVHRPDLIISDALMPRMDGFEFLRMVNMDDELKAIPFVFHSAVYTGLKDKELALSLGAEAFIAKPKEPEEFWEELAEIIKRCETGGERPPAAEPLPEEKEYLRKYSGVVAAKLEEKVRELEETLDRRKKAEEALIANQERLKTLAAELAHAEETERYRIAIELHDAVGQRLAQSRMMLNALATLPISPECIGRIDNIRGILDAVIDQVRSLIFRISPPVLYLVGFEAAVESLCEKFQEDFGIRITFTNDGESRTIAEDLRGGLYRMVQELLFNAVKHARAQTVAVSVKSVESGVEICVEDDGCGFDASRLFQYGDKRNCLGLFSIKERAEYLGGSMKIDSKPWRGTCVNLIVPI